MSVRTLPAWPGAAALMLACAGTPNSPSGGGAGGARPSNAAGVSAVAGALFVNGGSPGSSGGAMSVPGGTGSAGGGRENAGGNSGGAEAGAPSPGNAEQAGSAGTTSVLDCASPNHLCEDFEAANAPAPNVWTIKTYDGGTLLVDGTKPHRGARSLHITGKATLTESTTFVPPPAGNAFFGRMYVLRDATALTGHAELVLGTGNLVVGGNTIRPLVRYGLHAGGKYLATYYGNGLDAWQDGQTDTFPVSQWTCWEWHFDGAQNTMRLWIEEREIREVSVMGESSRCCSGQPWLQPSFDQLIIGWDGSTPGETWIDDVAVGPGRIGCGR